MMNLRRNEEFEEEKVNLSGKAYEAFYLLLTQVVWYR